MEILLTCGIGDFIAMESHAPLVERELVTSIHWATRARESIQQLVPFVFPNVEEHVVQRDTWGAPFTTEFCVSSRDDLPNLPPEVVDWSVKVVSDEIRTGQRRFHGSALMDVQLATLDGIPLPTRPYFVVHPFSENARTVERDLDPRERTAAFRHAAKLGYSCVVVNKGGPRIAVPPNVVDLSDKLTLFQTLEIVKRAAGFIGCASFPAVLAAQVLTPQWLFVKCNPSVKRFYHWLYYAPQSTNQFCSSDLLDLFPHG